MPSMRHERYIYNKRCNEGYNIYLREKAMSQV